MRIPQKTAGFAAAIACAGIITACHSTTSSVTTAKPPLNPALSATLSADQVKGLDRLRQCLPNGTSIVNTVMSGTASLDTYVTIASTFQGKNLQQVASRCLGAHPVKHTIRVFTTCTEHQEVPAVSKATQPYMQHPVRYHHLILQATGQATLRLAAACLGTVIK